MNVVIWILAGAFLGSVANLALGTRNRAGITLDVFIGIAGVLSGGWLLGVLTRTSAFAPGEFSPASFLVSLLVAAVLLTALQLFRGRSSRETTNHPDNVSAAPTIAGRATTTHMREMT